MAGGLYPQNVRVQDKTLLLYGGFVGGTAQSYADGSGGDFSRRDSAVNITHLQGDGSDSTVSLLNPGASRLDGFRITDGIRSLVPEYGIVGGGVYVSGGAPIIAHNLIENNDTRPSGGPLPSEPVGGGIFADDAQISILDNLIRNNTSGRGGGIGVNGGTALIQGNVVEGNVGVSDHGGGIYIAASQITITHNLIRGNEIGRALGYGWGGGVIVFGAGSRATLSFNRITGNYAPSVGSGVFIDDGAQALLDHELIYRNLCPDGGTTGGVGVYVDGYDQIGSQVSLNHTTVAGHDCATMGGNGLYVEVYSGVTIRNSIFWGNGGDDFFVDGTSRITATYTLAEEALPGVGNLAVDPGFANPAQDDYHLHSPAIDVGDPSADFSREPQPNGNRANLGAYGNTAQASKSNPARGGR